MRIRSSLSHITPQVWEVKAADLSLSPAYKAAEGMVRSCPMNAPAVASSQCSSAGSIWKGHLPALPALPPHTRRQGTGGRHHPEQSLAPCDSVRRSPLVRNKSQRCTGSRLRHRITTPPPRMTTTDTFSEKFVMQLVTKKKKGRIPVDLRHRWMYISLFPSQGHQYGEDGPCQQLCLGTF